ncbi:Glucose-6-phosphate dehydrogenase, NAD binding domain [Actinoplanes regularis]|uniref:Glucose-6-phosphate dehydrogenase, NAD binding domain n=2 Tax=Actinoplanes regularis TaxID=52697 RepID=A0A239IBV4_9ACTN|nr:hypothetical protein Are01nite_72420 [Actinoplanes regularis]SNS91051.1 Glucose-6-phosphate dehydrogenase, NAD binding domain [Actinoplanes regularis]
MSRPGRGKLAVMTVFVLFGATGDLAARMAPPVSWTLANEGLLPQNRIPVGGGRGDVSHEDSMPTCTN